VTRVQSSDSGTLSAIWPAVAAQARRDLWRDNLDEEASGNLNAEAAAGSGGMIVLIVGLGKHFVGAAL
jgi:hypothetical protein